MSKTTHYKLAELDGESTSFCELPEDFYPSKFSKKTNKIKPLKEGSTFGDGFCSKCKKALEDQELIDKE